MPSAAKLSELPTRSALALPESGKLRASIELALIVLLLEVEIWKLYGPFGHVFRAVAFPLIAWLGWRAYRRLRSTSIVQPTLWNLWRSWALCGAITVFLGGALLTGSTFLRAEGDSLRWFWVEKGLFGGSAWLFVKGIIVVAQQYALHLYLWPTFVFLSGNRSIARGCAAAVFGLIHLPSLVLVGITALAAFVWSWCYQRTGRITPLVLSHLVLAVSAHATLPERMSCNMRVGAAAMEVVDRYQAASQPALRGLFEVLCSDRYFHACGGTGPHFVQALYRDVLCRTAPPRDGEIQFWCVKLKGHSRRGVVSEFFATPEFAELKRQGHLSHIRHKVRVRLEGRTP